VQSELLRYKTEPSISVDQPPLHWWSAHQHLYPIVSKLAHKYLCVVATSVPSEQLFSTAGNVVSVKHSALLPENVEKLIFYVIICHQFPYLTTGAMKKTVMTVTPVNYLCSVSLILVRFYDHYCVKICNNYICNMLDRC